MPLDPGISLGVKVPDANANNPLGTLATFAGIQNQLNTNRLFQQTFAARQRAGQILSQSPDLEQGLEQLYRDPVTAPFAAETANAVRQGQQTFADIQRLRAVTAGEQQKQATDGLQAAVAHGLPAIIDNPTDQTWDNTMSAQLKVLSPSARAAVAPALESLKLAMLAGLPDDPAQARAEVKKRAAALSLGSGFTPESLAAVVGKPGIVDLGDVKQPTLERPGQAAVASGDAFSVGAAPRYEGFPGGVPAAVPAIPGAGRSSGNPLTGSGSGASPSFPAAAPAGNALGAEQPKSASPAAASAAGTEAVEPPGQPLGVAGNGELLILPASAKSPSVGTGAKGMQVLSPAQQKNAETLQTEFSGSGLRAYQNANSTLGSLESMSADLDTLAKGGGFLTPGSGAQFRADVAKALNTMADMAGLKERIEPDKIAAVDAFNKETNRMGLTVLTTMLGNQREAAQTINNITTKAVPGIENSFMGGKLVIEGLKATTQRAIDQRKFENAWQAKNQGQLAGAAEAFNAAYPAESYADSVLQKFGIGPKGFISPQAIVDAVKAGYMTPAQGKALGIKQFGGK
jgi:hypothetical protein